ncbi:hypothetical protein XA68_16056 [Ophiocordyceps unilateralis]|uniref:Uncharacterized protein n=1 Tax=Ophiocordyceps unilateralis TaxID=268505 RepID=A0A2A9P779_OPHUN|nr:hypothetical protein XA68_16056 [Ophiocordyceps unilateralis]
MAAATVGLRRQIPNARPNMADSCHGQQLAGCCWPSHGASPPPESIAATNGAGTTRDELSRIPGIAYPPPFPLQNVCATGNDWAVRVDAVRGMAPPPVLRLPGGVAGCVE